MSNADGWLAVTLNLIKNTCHRYVTQRRMPAETGQIELDGVREKISTVRRRWQKPTHSRLISTDQNRLISVYRIKCSSRQLELHLHVVNDCVYTQIPTPPL